jgi:hypothetical protein
MSERELTRARTRRAAARQRRLIQYARMTFLPRSTWCAATCGRGGAGGSRWPRYFDILHPRHVFLLLTLPLSSRPALNAAMYVAAPQEVGV